MNITETYVSSVNGKTGQLPYELDYLDPEMSEQGEFAGVFGTHNPPQRVLFLDANDIQMNGMSGNTIPQEIQRLCGSINPLIMKETGDGSYAMCVGSGFPYQPVET